MYLLDWFSIYGYCGLWLIVGIIAIFNAKLAFIISCSNSIAIVLGQIITEMVLVLVIVIKIFIKN